MSQKYKSRAEIHNSSRRSRKKPRKKRGFRRFLNFVGILLILTGVGLLLLDPIKNHFIRERTNMNTVANVSRDDIVRNNGANVSFDWTNISALDARQVLMSNVNPEDLPVIGGVAMPELGMNLPIYKGASQEGMFYGAGTLYPEQEMGKSNYSIASHHSIHKDLLFAPLLHAEYGQKIYLTDLEKIYEYEVTNIETISPDRVDVTYPTEVPTITMITCDSGLVNRVIVQGTLKETYTINDAPKESLDAFKIKQTVPEQN